MMPLKLFLGALLSVLAFPFTAVAVPPITRGKGAATTPGAGSTRDLFLKEILSRSPSYGNFQNSSLKGNGRPKVGIIGAGAAGLYAAVILDSLNISYEILESSNRIGGRILTHRFDEKAWNNSKPGEPDYYDYFDVGAMRFPGMDWMNRIIGEANNSLIPYINSKLEPDSQQIKLIHYIYQANDTFRLFNDKLIFNQVKPSAQAFGVMVSQNGTINNDTFATLSPQAVFDSTIDELMQGLSKNFDTGFKILMEYDNLSIREYLLMKGYSSEEIDWIETVADATTHYDTYSLAQGVLEEWIFNDASLTSWVCVEGGMDRIIDGMVKIISKTVETGKRVTAIKMTANNALKLIINADEERTYDHIINTVPLGALQIMDMTELKLDYRKKLGIRKLQYDPAGKIGMKFKTRWWESLQSGSFQGGQSFSDLPIRRCVYPSYGLDVPGAPGTMIASYTWGQDSARLGSYYNNNEAREHIIETTLHNLAAMHNVSYEFLQSQYVESYFRNWYDGEDAVGAFAMFGPGEYSSVLPALMMPAANGKLHFAGEALSSGHAWIIGAINSAYRTVAEILAVEKMDQNLIDMVSMWGLIDEVDMGWYSDVFAK